MAFRRVMALGELWNGDMVARTVDGKRVLLARVDDAVYAYEDRCAHLGVPLSEGKLAGTTLTCTAHHYQYDVCTGLGVNPRSVCLRAYAVQVEGGDVLVDVTQATRSVRP